MDQTQDELPRRQIIEALSGENAHIGFDSAVADFPPELRGVKPAGAPHSAWQLLEHMRIAQWDILEFSRDPQHKSPKWPDEYWPESTAPANAKEWEDSIEAFRRDLQSMEDLIAASHSGLFSPLPHGTGQTLLREALLIANHTSYHLGQLMFLKRILVPAEG